mgnify:CR=1 FL=1
MKPEAIAPNSRAAFYLKTRRESPAMPAARALEMAARRFAWREEAQRAHDTASAALAALWAAMGKVEPKRYAPEGEALAAARAKAEKARADLTRLSCYAPEGLARPRAAGGHCRGYFGNGAFYYLESDDGAGVFRGVMAAHDCEGGPSHNGWYTNPHGESFRDGSGLCWGVVARLTGKDGRPRFLAGYQFGGMDSGVSIDLESLTDCERDAARRADSLAENAANAEKEYQAAWGAGNRWADLAGEVVNARREALAILKERREAQRAANGAALPALCGAIRAQVSGLLDSIREAREEMETLANGDAESYWFDTGETRLRAAFCEGAGLQEMPA